MRLFEGHCIALSRIVPSLRGTSPQGGGGLQLDNSYIVAIFVWADTSGWPYIDKMGTHKGCPYGTILLLIILQGVAEGEDAG